MIIYLIYFFFTIFVFWIFLCYVIPVQLECIIKLLLLLSLQCRPAECCWEWELCCGSWITRSNFETGGRIFGCISKSSGVWECTVCISLRTESAAQNLWYTSMISTASCKLSFVSFPSYNKILYSVTKKIYQGSIHSVWAHLNNRVLWFWIPYKPFEFNCLRDSLDTQRQEESKCKLQLVELGGWSPHFDKSTSHASFSFSWFYQHITNVELVLIINTHSHMVALVSSIT